MEETKNEQVISEQPEQLQGQTNTTRQEPAGNRLLWVSLTTLGIVYGDIGTSPLYAFRDCFRGDNSVGLTPANILGVLSLIFWSLVVVISIKYIIYVMRADNRGEGGILATNDAEIFDRAVAEIAESTGHLLADLTIRQRPAHQAGRQVE